MKRHGTRGKPSAKAKVGLKFSKVSLKIEAMKYGYARVSTDDQKADMQRAALTKAGDPVLRSQL
jgi:hypothetical protein